VNILFSGGGTAGHINPAVAIAKYALEQNKDNKILFVGTKRGLESTLVPKEGFDIKYVNVDGLEKKINIKNMISAFKMGVAVIKSIGIMKKFKPDVVIGTGGYVCVSSVVAAHILKIPSLIHEQNVFPGSAVKFLADKADVTAISFDESRKYIKNAKSILLTGNPIRPAILSHKREECRKKLGIGNRKFIVSFGGSLGANRINDVMTDFVTRNLKNDDLVIYFATGKRDYERIASEFEKMGVTLTENIKLLEYIDNMDIVMNAADLVVCRSGAITLAELCALKRPSVLIPSPNVTNNHQEYNARALSDNGAAITICEKDFNLETLTKAVYSVVYDERKASDMSEAAGVLAITDATDKIYKTVCQLVK